LWVREKKRKTVFYNQGDDKRGCAYSMEEGGNFSSDSSEEGMRGNEDPSGRKRLRDLLRTPSEEREKGRTLGKGTSVERAQGSSDPTQDLRGKEKWPRSRKYSRRERRKRRRKRY